MVTKRAIKLKERKQKEKRNAKIFAFIVMAILIIGIAKCTTSFFTPKEDNDPRPWESGTKCATISQILAKRHIKFSDKADFSYEFEHESYSDSSAYIQGEFVVIDEFGVEKKYKYFTILHYKGGKWSDISNWSNDDFSFTEVN